MKRHVQYLRNEVIEAITAQRIREYESMTGVPVRLPVPVEQIVEPVVAVPVLPPVVPEPQATRIANKSGILKVSEKIRDQFLHICS